MVLTDKGGIREINTIKQVYSFRHLFPLSGYKGRYVSSDNCKVKRQNRSGYNLPLYRAYSIRKPCICQRHTGKGIRQREQATERKQKKTAYTEHLGMMLPGKLFFFLRMANTTGRRRTALFQEKQKVRFKTLIGFSMNV